MTDQGSNIPVHTVKTAFGSSLGYGIVCGLMFPLMVSSTFLQEMSLAHGAGHSFGALFFAMYILTMILTALDCLFRRKQMRQARMRSAFACVFIGNVLLLFHNLGFIDNGWIYAIASASCIGYGLATAELGWLARIAMQQEDAEGSFSILSIVPAAFLIGGLMTAFIFWAEWPFELIFALVSTVIAAAPLIKAQPLEKEGRRIGISSAGATDFMKAVSYLGVFSFTFGAVSQVANVAGGTSPSIEFQAVAGIVIAALAMAVVGHIRRRTPSLSNLYGMLFPIVALSLIALPFTASAARAVAVTLVFIAFYLSGMNARVIIVRLSQRDNVSLWVYLSVALGISGLLILAGVAFGAFAIDREDPAVGLALISLISLFILALNPILSSFLERSGKGDTPFGHASASHDSEAHASPMGRAVAGAQEPEDASLIAAFAHEHSLTTRESEVLMLLRQGRTRTYIAAELGLSPNTVKGYIHSLYQKSEAHDKQDLLDRIEQYSEEKRRS